MTDTQDDTKPAGERKEPYSQFTIDKARSSKENGPTIQGQLTVIMDGTPVAGRYAGWGPNAPQEAGKREFYRIAWEPADPALAARQKQMQTGHLEMPAPPNANQGLKLDRVGAGVLFETTPEERAAAKERGHVPRSYFGAVRILTPDGARDVDLSASHRQGISRSGKPYDFHSGSARPHDPERARDRSSPEPADKPRERARGEGLV